MLRNNTLLGTAISFLLGCILTSIFFIKFNIFSHNKNDEDWEITKKILTLQVDSLKKENDSLLLKVSYQDSSLSQIEKEYEENSTNLLNKPIEYQYGFFSEYLDKYNWRHDSCNNTETTTRH